MLMIVVLFVGCSSTKIVEELSPPITTPSRILQEALKQEELHVEDYPQWANRQWRMLTFVHRHNQEPNRIYYIDIDSYNPELNTFETIQGKLLSLGNKAYTTDDCNIILKNWFKYETFPCTQKGVWHPEDGKESTGVAKCKKCGRYYGIGRIYFSTLDGNVNWTRYR
jgi:hypothetical protein